MVWSSPISVSARIPQWTRGVGRPAFWAWSVSIGVHLIVLTAFGLVRFSKAEAQNEQGPVSSGKISRIRELSRAMPVTAKPKIKKPAMIAAWRGFAPAPEKPAPVGLIFESAKPALQSWGDAALSGPRDRAGELSTSGTIEFFGSSAFERKVCYLVDCSGSMQGIFPLVRRKLKESINSLQADQYFYVIFFGGGKLFELGGGRLLRATAKTKSAANSFIDNMKSAGETNAAAALDRVVRIRDGKGASPSVVYFLTDGFELTSEDSAGFSQRIADLLKRFAPAMKINTIAFLARDDDRRMLETVARESGGGFMSITGER